MNDAPLWPSEALATTPGAIRATASQDGVQPVSDGRSIRVLSLSSLFPNEAQPRHGIFLLHRLAHLAMEHGVALRVVAPVPWFPRALRALGRYAPFADAPRRSEPRGIPTQHPRYLVVPKLGTRIAALLMAAALLPSLLRIRREGFDFDVIDAYYLYPDGVAAALLGWLLRRPVVLTAFGSDVSQLPSSRVVRSQIMWAVRRAAEVTTVCQALKDRLVELGAEPAKIEVILHGVDLRLFQPPADRAALRRRLGMAGPTVISVGHLIPRKGNELAIAALARLPGTQLLIAGTGPEEAALRLAAASFGVQDRVSFLGHVDQRDLRDLIGAADALVLCSHREGIANVLMEALACGTPVAATPVWGSPEIIRVPEAGILFRDRSVEAVAEGLGQLLANPPDRGITRRWAERFTWADTAAAHAALIRASVGAAPPAEMP